ncbi:MAG: SDR family NAD(P)-dependent oxidoreductase [Deltaproteobacteria bacterium]|nr:SDR family NAD(P)-dependent oxidoreductase [Deltaproteobacteria bacterium]
MARARETALITGASGGIGLELAQVFAEHGFDLIVVARREAELEALAGRCREKHGVRVHVLPMDLLVPDAPAKLVQQLADAGLEVDILVNNAGLMDVGGFADIGERGRGRILNVASTASFQPVPSMALYAASKAFVLSLSESLSEELKGTGVTVTVTKTDMYERAHDQHAVARNLPELFLSDVEDVAREGYEACVAGRAVVVPGLPNRLLASAVQLYPRWLVRSIGGLIGRRATR